MDNNLSSVQTAAEIADMRSTIDDIQKILQILSHFIDRLSKDFCFEIICFPLQIMVQVFF